MIDREKIMMDAFKDELEKTAIPNPLSLGKVLQAFTKLKNFGTASNQAFKNKNLLNYLSRHGSGKFGKGKSGNIIYKGHRPPKMETGFLQKVTGNIAQNIKAMKQGYNPRLGILSNAKQLGKNLGKLTQQQIRGGRYRLVAGNKVTKLPGTNTLVYRNKFKLPFSKKEFNSPFTRKVQSQYGKKYVVRKSAPFQALGVASTPVGFGATTLAMDPTPKGLKEGAKEFTQWTFAPPVATANLIKDMFKNTSKNT